jgi:uncharacterized integral membrane protein
MNALANFSTILLVAGWMAAIALISVQNAQPISLEFFGQKSVAMPFGLMLTAATIVGMVGLSLLQPLLLPTRRDRAGQEDV